jgi:hypothetical protein
MALIICSSLSAAKNDKQSHQFTPQEKKALQLWDNFVSDKKFRWVDYVDKLAVILRGQKRYEKFVAILKRNRNGTSRDLFKEINRELKARNLEFLDDWKEADILWQPEDNRNLGKFYPCEMGCEMYLLLCERMDGKSQKKCSGDFYKETQK